MIKAIAMDFNGVIIDDEPIQMQAYKEVLGGEGVEVTEESYLASLGMDEVAFVRNAYAIREKPLDEKRMHELIAAKQAMWREIVGKELPLFPGITDFVEKMAREFTLGIVSMAPRDEIELVLDRGGMRKHFSVVVSAENVKKCKPDPECFRIGFQQIDAMRTSQGHLPMTHGECLDEDSPPGIVAARNADLRRGANTVDAAALRRPGPGRSRPITRLDAGVDPTRFCLEFTAETRRHRERNGKACLALRLCVSAVKDLGYV
jgi:beta-phosphoglucomutase-like phosphatase (HAD superfamily)